MFYIIQCKDISFFDCYYLSAWQQELIKGVSVSVFIQATGHMVMCKMKGCPLEAMTHDIEGYFKISGAF